MPDIEIRFESDQDEGGAARLERWLVEAGGTVDAGQPVAELETDKVTLEVCSPAAGRLLDLAAQPGESVAPGQVIGRLAVTDNGDAAGGVAAPLELVYSEDQAEGGSATLARWVVAEGEPVRAGDPVVEVETDKVNLEIVAPASGHLIEQRVEPGAAIDVGAVLGRIQPGPDAEPVPSAAADPAPEPEEETIADLPGRERLSPAVRRLAREHDIDLSRVRGSGRGGRIRREDLQALIEQGGAPVTPSPAPSDAVPSRHVPHTSMRRSIARHMVESLLETSPHVTSVFEADLTRIVRHRRAMKDEFARRGANLTYTAYFLSAAARAMTAVPEVNARFHEDSLELFEDVNIGIGTALGNEGLIVPVVPRVQTLDLFGIAAALHDKTERARTGKLSSADLKGGTFTISNHGVSGSLFAAPIIINQPQVAILGIGKLEKRVKVMDVDGEDTLRIRSMCYVSLSIDHRALDAYQTNHWLSVFVDALENWPDAET